MEIDYKKLTDYFENNFDLDGSIRKEINNLKNTTLTIRNIPRLFNSLYVVTLGVIVSVEKFSSDIETLQSEQKRKSVVKVIEESIKLDFIMELFDGLLVEFIINKLVDLLNNEFGHDWSGKISEIFDTNIIKLITPSDGPTSTT